jgi:hypothetical protein
MQPGHGQIYPCLEAAHPDRPDARHLLEPIQADGGCLLWIGAPPTLYEEFGIFFEFLGTYLNTQS